MQNKKNLRDEFISYRLFVENHIRKSKNNDGEECLNKSLKQSLAVKFYIPIIWWGYEIWDERR